MRFLSSSSMLILALGQLVPWKILMPQLKDEIGGGVSLFKTFTKSCSQNLPDVPLRSLNNNEQRLSFLSQILTVMLFL